MDQVKVILGYLRKYHFWLLCVIAMITGLVGWYMASKRLSASYDQKKGEVVKAFSSLQALQGQENPPNSSWTTEINKLTEQEKAKVRTTWQKVYDDQAKMLEWPKSLGDDFLEHIAKHETGEIQKQQREWYHNHIAVELAPLAAIIGADTAMGKKPAATGTPGTPDAAPPVADSSEFKVVWDPSSQAGVRRSIEWDKVPTSDQIRIAQEDLWIYAALLHVIKAANQDSPNGIPRIKRVQTLLIGRDAADAYEQGMAPIHVEHLAGAPAPPAQAAPPPDAAAGIEGVQKPADDMRYVDAEGKKLPGGSAGREQYKRLPFYLSVTMDQREVYRLLAEFANAQMPMDIRQVRINSGKSAAPVPTAAPAGGGTGNAMRAGRGGGASAAPTVSAGPTSTSAADTYEMPVTLNGVIYIYNRPDLNKLGAPPGAQPGAQPAAAPVESAGG